MLKTLFHKVTLAVVGVLAVAAGAYVGVTIWQGMRDSRTEGEVIRYPIDMPEECRKKVGHRLQIMMSGDPEEVARRTREEGLSYEAKDGFTRVVITLVGGSNVEFDGYRIRIEARSGNLVQASIHLEDICELAKEPQIINIRRSVEPIPFPPP